MEERARRQKSLRVALLVQAIGLLAMIAVTVPDYIYIETHPDLGLMALRGLAFLFAVIVFGPAIGMLLLLGWRWRGPRLWPLAVVAVIDAAAIALAAVLVFQDSYERTVSIEASAPALLLLPALATLVLGTNLVRPVPWKPALAVSAAGCLLSSAVLWLHVTGPQAPPAIPGPSLAEVNSARQAAIAKTQALVYKVSLPATLINQGVDQGCTIYGPTTFGTYESTIRCSYLQLMYARGSGNKAADRQMTIDRLTAAGASPEVVSVFDNVDQLNSGLYDGFPREIFRTAFSHATYLYGYAIETTYVQATCEPCSRFQQENHAHTYPDPGITRATPLPMDFDSLIPSVPARFDQMQRHFSHGALYSIYNKSSSGVPKGSYKPELNLVEFRPPIYYNPPAACGDDVPDSGSIDPCTLFAVTPGGNSVYRGSVQPLLFVRLRGTLVVIRESPEVGSQLDERELVSLVDSLARATPEQMKTIKVE